MSINISLKILISTDPITKAPLILMMEGCIHRIINSFLAVKCLLLEIIYLSDFVILISMTFFPNLQKQTLMEIYLPI